MWLFARGRFGQQLKVIEEAVVAGIQGRLDRGLQREAGREAHKLAGSLGTFGSHEGSRLARALELELTAVDLVDPAHAMDLSQLVLDLQLEINRPIAKPAPRPLQGSGHPATVLVVDANVARAARVAEAAAGLALHAACTASVGDARQLISSGPPDVVVIYADAGSAEELEGFLAELAGREPVVISVLIVGHAGVSERVRGARAGAQIVLEAPVPPDTIAQAVSRLVKRARAISTVLLLDDDPTFRILIRELLRAQGLVVVPLEDSSGLWAALEAVEPDLLLLDNDMPGADGISLCRAIRSDERWARLPVVFLSGSRSPEVVREMFAAGADDFVPKPVSVDDLVNRVISRLERSRVQSERPDVDLATGLPIASAFVRAATRLVGLAGRGGRPAVFAVVEVDPPSGPALGGLARLLRQSADAEDAVGAWSGGRLAALLYGTTGPEAKARLGRVLQSARAASSSAEFRAVVGLAGYPEDGPDVWALSAAAETALGRARQASGDAIELHERPGRGRPEVVDVLLVDDDEALAALVLHALSGRGWSVRWLQDGAEAVKLLDDPAFHARTVLLDVGLPGLDGLSVLRHLGGTARLATTRVVMLTVRANEREVLEALDLGAFDHVGKPFSLSVLLHRVRRALEANR